MVGHTYSMGMVLRERMRLAHTDSFLSREEIQFGAMIKALSDGGGAAPTRPSSESTCTEDDDYLDVGLTMLRDLSTYVGAAVGCGVGWGGGGGATAANMGNSNRGCCGMSPAKTRELTGKLPDSPSWDIRPGNPFPSMGAATESGPGNGDQAAAGSSGASAAPGLSAELQQQRQRQQGGEDDDVDPHRQFTNNLIAAWRARGGTDPRELASLMVSMGGAEVTHKPADDHFAHAWTADEDSALVLACRKFRQRDWPKATERWKQIAQELHLNVGTNRGKRECRDRLRKLRGKADKEMKIPVKNKGRRPSMERIMEKGESPHHVKTRESDITS